jgi:hypothetical protein
MTLTTRRDGRFAAHPDWCARGHRCGLGEHRSIPVTVATAGAGLVVLTRILAAGGREHVEIRVRIGLAPGEASARAHLAQIVTGFAALLRRVTRMRR